MSLTRESEPSKDTDEIFDFVLVMGIDRSGETAQQEFYKQIASLCKSRHLKYRIIGDGKTLVNLEELDNLPKANHVAIYGHGRISHDHDGVHKIKICKAPLDVSLDLVIKVQQQTHSKNILFCSCYGAKIVDDAKKRMHPVLEGGTSLFAPSPDDDIAWLDHHNSIIMNYVNNINPSQVTSMIPLVVGTIKTIAQSLEYFPVPDYKIDISSPLRSFTIRRTAREVHDEVEKLCDWQINRLNDFIDQLMLDGNHMSLVSELRHTFPHFDAYYKYLGTDEQIKLLSSKMTNEQIHEYQQSSIKSHIRHNDVKIVDKLLEKTTFGPDLLAEAIVMHREKSYHRNMEQMVDTILKHGNNVTQGQNVNSFAPDASFFDYIEQYKQHSNKILIALLYTPLTLALAENDCKMSNISIIQFVSTNDKVVKTLLDRGADMYLPDAFGTIPAAILYRSQYRDLFLKERNEALKMYKCVSGAEILLNELNESERLDHARLIDQIKNIISKKAEWKRIGEEKKDTYFYEYLDYPPKNRQVFEAYKSYMEAANNINIKDILNVAKQLDKPDLLNRLLKKMFDPLTVAATNGDLDTVNILLDYGANIEEIGEYQLSPLQLAIQKNRLNVVKALIAKGADIHAHVREFSPLEMAAFYGGIEIFYTLLEEDKRQGIFEQDWESLIFKAIRKMPLEVIEDLCSRCKNTSIRNTENQTLFEVAMEKNRDDLLELFMDETLINKPDKSTIYPLHQAVRKDNARMCEIILQHGAKTEVGDYYGDTPLHFAATSRNPLYVRALLNVGADLNAKNRNDLTPVQLAVKNGYLEPFEAFVEKDPTCVNQVDAEGRSLLFYAKNSEMFKAIMKHGVKWRDTEELQSLFMAENGNDVIWEMLLNEGANLNTPDKDGHTALDLANSRYDYQKINYIRFKEKELKVAKALAEKDWSQQRLILIDKVKTEIKNNMDYLGITTKNPDKKILLNSLMDILLYKEENLQHETPSHGKLSEFPEIDLLRKEIIKHMEKRLEIKDDIAATSRSMSFGKK